MAIIDKPTDYFDSVLYTGNTSTGTTISSLDFAPNMVWFKSRTQAENHQIYDSVRGVTKRIIPNGTQAEATASTGLTNFDSNGFRTGGENETDSGNIVAWNWKANGAGVSNTDGSITSTVSANTTSGFSIVSYTGTGSAGTVGTGLGAVPKMIIIKDRSAADNWNVYNSSSGNNSHMHLNLNNTESGSSSYWNTTTPTSSVFSLGSTSAVNANGNNFIAYCFAEKSGYSSMGSYIGNASTNGTFVYTGFKPAFVMVKKSAGTGSWAMQDNKRTPFNVQKKSLFANLSDVETDSTNDAIDVLSNGFKFRSDTANYNTSGDAYIFMCFAENPFVSSTGVPATAR